MSNFTVKSNYFLRNLYKNNSSLANKSSRTDVDPTTLQSADEKALRNGLSSLSSFNYEDDDKNELTATKAKYYNKLRAFVDSYNYTIDSGNGNSSDSSIRSKIKSMKALTKKYSSELENIGISSDSKGYLSLSKTALDNIKISTYEDMFGADSKYAKELSKYSKSISNHIDEYA